MLPFENNDDDFISESAVFHDVIIGLSLTSGNIVPIPKKSAMTFVDVAAVVAAAPVVVVVSVLHGVGQAALANSLADPI